VSNDKLFYILNSYMSHCGGSGWGVLMKKRDVLDYRFLAINTGSSISISVTYIVFVTKMQKRQIPEKGFAPIENDITGSELALKYGIHSRNM
jgi:hypothetical protein